MSPSRSAFTLIELITSLAILLLVFTALFALYHTALRATQVADQTTVESGAAAAIDSLLRDLTCAVGPDGGDEDCGLKTSATESGENASEAALWLSFCATPRFSEAGDPRWYSLERLIYRWSADEPALARISMPFVGGTAETNVLSPRVAQLRVEFFDGAQWHTAWSGDSLPRAARVTWQDEGQIRTAETFIAAGMVFTSSAVSTLARPITP